MSNYQDISTGIVACLTAVQVDGSSAFEDIKEFPTTEFTGTPAATVVPSETQSNYQTVMQNLRTYGFDVDLYYTVQTDNDGLANSFAVMRKLVDATLDALDNSDSLNNTVQILRPTPAAWSMLQSSKGTLLSARITVQAATLVDTNNG